MGQSMFNGRVAVVTGGTKGIGKAIALHLGEHGARIAAVYGHDREAAEGFHKDLTERGHQGDIFACDVTEPAQLAATIDHVAALFGRIDILVNNAGITCDKTVAKMAVDEWHKVLRTNLSSCFYACHAVLPHMVARQYGRIINISSMIGLSGNIGQANYASAKAGMIGFTKTLALETARKGITVNAVAPGFVKTDMTDKIQPAVTERILEHIPMRRFAEPYEISRVVVFLAEEESGYITGQVYGINGGLYM
jgi:3-oxoacyl-(acyl-carrier-protein) reductase